MIILLLTRTFFAEVEDPKLAEGGVKFTVYQEYDLDFEETLTESLAKTLIDPSRVVVEGVFKYDRVVHYNSHNSFLSVDDFKEYCEMLKALYTQIRTLWDDPTIESWN